MQLETAHVTHFRSVEDSEVFQIGPVTCLVGKNEAGKSALLMALAALNPHAATPAIFDKERDYPRRHLMQYGQRHPDKDAVAITTTWQMDEDELQEIAEAVGVGVVSNPVTICRRYGQAIEIGTIPNLRAGLDFLYEKFALDESERSVFSSITTSSELIGFLKTFDALTERHKALQAHLAKQGSITDQVKILILGMLPKFMYFSSYDRMEGAIQLEQAKQLIQGGQITQDAHRGIRLFTEFLDYAGISVDEIASVSTYETFNARLQAASNNITDQVLEYWTQNPDLGVEVKVETARVGDAPPFNSGTIARARIYNHLHRVDTPFSERSAGFVWFFSFLVKFAQVKDEEAPVVLLLDEPGLTLHGKAQADLLRFFKEKLAPHHQIVYSTHSPFMVPADDLSAVRIVEDQIEMKGSRRLPIGTKVRDDVLTRDPDTLFPLQGALGYEISQSLFVGKHTLLVEGPGDILYIQALSDALCRRQRVGLDPRWTICPAGGIDKIRPFVGLFAGNELNVAVLSDQAAGDKRKIDELKRSQVLRAGHLYTVADFLGRAEADIEDLFSPEIFVAMLNGCYALEGSHILTVDKLKAAAPSTERLVKQAEAAFRVMPDTIPMFDHFTPAAWLIRNAKLLDAKSAAAGHTLDLVEKVFATFNELL